jgi:hypothetical protein
MAPWLAAAIVTWVAMLVLYLGLAATLRKVNVLTAELAAIRAAGSVKASGIKISLPGYAGRLVLAADTSCPTCHLTVKALNGISGLGLQAKPVLLTYEPESEWEADALEIRRDPQAWRAVAHLSPPVLLSVDGEGSVARLALPSHPDDVTRSLAAWGLLERTQR